ncbi:major facilitator superfamily domain-containing protein 3-like [Asterias rubens]|uniref:major facilitator superfamily domain-containing protein 3-like n=1 Tax=Asterias rubens TaxID=7604 RepID=UPI0014550EF9|nr:major facilitator superfamily domain-containing protein 3-like [Asterias rubens]XP_033647051.1 major facilitator superfamily domain-containing protein 3-like [Asterias rubens]XP_033647057.1 major facilitator superfamily domain-containing protein 3-like [Asterias rubens]
MTGFHLYRFVNSKILCLLLLYFVQGIPYGFQAGFLPIFLRSQGTSLTSVGFFKILLLPWMLKVLWAPLLECYTSRRTGLICSLVAMVLAWAFGACISPEQTVLLCVIVFCLNLTASMQDVIVDAIAIGILRESELGAGNTAQVVGYKVGSIVGGGVFIWLIVYIGWQGLFISISGLYVVTTFLVMQLDDLKRCNIDKSKTSNSVSIGQVHGQQEGVGVTQEDDFKGQSFTHLIRDIVTTPHTKWMMIFVTFYKLGEMGSIGMFPLYLVDHGIPVGEVGFLTGVISQGLSILGSLAGGWMLSNQQLSLTPSHLLPVLFKLRLLPLLLQTAVICFNQPNEVIPLYGLCLVAMCLLQLIGGAITICTFTLMMQCSQQAPHRIQATHYTALATIEVMGKLVFMSVAGWLVDWLGYGKMFCLFLSLSVGVLAMLRPEIKAYLS